MKKNSYSERLYDIVIAVILGIIALITVYPFIFVVSMSLSDSMAAFNNEVYLFPKGLTLEAYKIVFKNKEIWNAYLNTIIYATIGAAICVTFTVMAAFSLSRKTFVLRKYIMVLIILTMFLNGGLVPLFIIVNKLGIYNTRLAVLLPGVINTWWLIIARSFFNTNVPDSLYESAKIDGASEFTLFIKIALPLSKTIISILILFSAVYYWNSYFLPSIFLVDSKLYPLSIILRKILVEGSILNTFEFDESAIYRYMVFNQLKYSTIVIAIIPIMCVYPFVQKYFIRGILIGAVKE